MCFSNSECMFFSLFIVRSLFENVLEIALNDFLSRSCIEVELKEIFDSNGCVLCVHVFFALPLS